MLKKLIEAWKQGVRDREREKIVVELQVLSRFDVCLGRRLALLARLLVLDKADADAKLVAGKSAMLDGLFAYARRLAHGVRK